MRKLLLYGVLALFLLFATACVSDGKFRVERSDANDHLLIGALEYEAHGWGTGVDGVYHDGLSLILQNMVSKKRYELQQTALEKIFYISSIEPGTYQLVNIKYKSSSSYLNWNITKFRIQVKENQVTNIGVILYYADKTAKNYKLTNEKRHDEVKALFEKRFPNSNWLGESWEDAQY